MQSEHSDSTLRGAELQRLLNLVERLSNGPPEELPASHRTLKTVFENIPKLIWPLSIVFIAWILESNNTVSNFLNNKSIIYKNRDMIIEINQNNDVKDSNGLFILIIEENYLENNELAKVIMKKNT